jgi:exopolysaccharide biosynthesis polyprenyl glycosylphosphotransferase
MASSKKAAHVAKRILDVTGSLFAILLLSPVFLFLAAAVKLTSKGPVLFRQTRIGQYGRPFTFLKFRSMHANNNSKIHEEYVKKLIAGKGDKHPDGKNGSFKLTNDPRITSIGRFIRRTSLDELPQFFNVLKGEMSLVGPRPPVPYEYEAYDVWHRDRMMFVKPGITGLWQVTGRSKTTFDEMVRLDLHYAGSWSILMDLKILIQTPKAVFSGDGAY